MSMTAVVAILARVRRAAPMATLLWAGLLMAGEVGAAGSPAVRGDPFKGRELLVQKLCTQCHSVWGHGGGLAPDMSTAVAGKNWPDLVGDFWNHTPRMIDAVTSQGHSWPTMTYGEMADLLSYMYYLRIFDEPGDATNGSIVFSQLQCISCHSLAGKGGDSGGPLDGFSAYPSPMILAQAMWNAGPAMQRYQLGHGTPIPMFSGNEMADIQAFIRSRGLRAGREVSLMPLPDPANGAEVYVSKRCGACHRAGSREAPDLSGSVIHMTVSEISGILWNHSYAMNDRMRARGIPFPVFKGSEMADLIAYLHLLGFFEEKGDPVRGRGIVDEKGCASCHEGSDAVAEALVGTRPAGDPVALSAAMWNHAPEMHRLMAERSVAWPTFDRGEMADLAAYLRTLPVKQGDARQ